SQNEQFSQIYDQYISKIYRFVYLKVDSEETAQDITSKVFLKGWEAFQGQGSTIKNPGAFLYQIARNSVIDHYREKARSKVISADASPEIADPKADAKDQAILNADVSAVKKSIKKLDQEYQDIIIWHYLDDMPIADIAKLIDRPAGTVRVMLHRGLKDLKGLVQES
ncbi:MAG: RNA polymerase sigma factor, partial [Candidatus Staskawiczbacteria bacterium]|nr:RNA polymerase sigma factor [Candidatus Staskawiczbacteria bacterium]